MFDVPPMCHLILGDIVAKAFQVLDFIGGADADRTRDLLNAIQALSQTELQPHREARFFS